MVLSCGHDLSFIRGLLTLKGVANLKFIFLSHFSINIGSLLFWCLSNNSTRTLSIAEKIYGHYLNKRPDPLRK